tara:strand:- start:1269 stop:1598 length:330 start_codon:yes stop_codon:yes gene_type:complete
MKYIQNHTDFSETNKQAILFNKEGEATKVKNKEKIYARSVVKNKNELYYIRVHQNSPFDPMGTYGKRNSAWVETKMQQVSKATFDFYMMYLRTKNSLYMTRARRGLTND